ncbi:alpha/beta fold hydrolase [Bacillus sp. KH172YL63]|uniref:alpha/beta fold hydrolase n=1 Tax=Bacillus sp. KH172YL63 TaxID=2709784 RepID=UPI0013E4C573|nr:alpha/beta hydrolase [Bacillus sp. KH172YL63]BCB05650.1 AB hydrolase superfamily protein YvaM [Bacillus sp. KH172YL63]
MPCIHLHDRDLYYEDIGKGTPLLFIHPPGMGRMTFIKQHSLSSHFRLIIPDLTGHGDSFTLKQHCGIDEFIADISAVLDHLDISRCVVIGYSAGGVIGQAFSRSFEERVSFLILIGGYPKVTNPKLKWMHHIGMRMTRHHPSRLADIISRAHFRDRSDRETLRKHMYKANPYIWHHYYMESLHYDGIQQVESLSVPLLLIYGEYSDWINSHASLFDDCHPKKIYTIQGASHQIPTRYHHALNNILIGEIGEFEKR